MSSSVYYSLREKGNPITIFDDGVSITSNVGSINFTGAGVNVSTMGNDVTVDIPGGGGTVYTETPSGLINGSNTVYTVAHTINTIYNFVTNGQDIVDPSTYTVVGNTITFNSPLPAEFAGLQFIIVYA